jgi:dsRNA-specific ribonuclease
MTKTVKFNSKKLSPKKSEIINESHNGHHDQENLLPFVLNEHNKYISSKFIEEMLETYGIDYKVKNLNKFQIAMTHSSYMDRDLTQERLPKLIKEKDLKPIPKELINKAIPLQLECYQRLEFLGDSVIHLILADYLTDRYRDQQEGFLTKLRTKIENGKVLSKFSKYIGLNNYMLIARNLELIGGRENNESAIEDIFEAFIGALFEDSNSNYNMCYKFVESILEEKQLVDFSNLIHVETNFKDLLLQYYHQMRWADPEYGSVCIKEDGNKKYYTMYVKGLVITKNGENEWVKVGEGIGTSKKKGEQEAAKNALIKFGQIQENSGEEVYEEIYDENSLVYE